MGCFGIVEGEDAVLTKETAEHIKIIAVHDTWIPATTTVFGTGKFREEDYLKRALQAVIGGSVDRFKSAEDISLRLLWFKSEKELASRKPVEIGDGAACMPLREVIMAQSGERTLKHLSLCYKKDASQTEQIEVLKQYAKEASISHEATVLRVIPERLRAFLKQEFGDDTN